MQRSTAAGGLTYLDPTSLVSALMNNILQTWICLGNQAIRVWAIELGQWAMIER